MAQAQGLTPMNSHLHPIAVLFGLLVIWAVLLDAFETVVLPRRVTRHFKLTAWFYRRTWVPWRRIAGRIKTFRGSRTFWDISAHYR